MEELYITLLELFFASELLKRQCMICCMYAACCYTDTDIFTHVHSITMLFSRSMLTGLETIIEQMIKMMTILIYDKQALTLLHSLLAKFNEIQQQINAAKVLVARLDVATVC